MLSLSIGLLTFLTAIWVSTFAMASGGEGAIIFVPFFLMLGVDLNAAIATAFITQAFGKSSGTIGWLVKKDEAGKPFIQWNIVILLLAAGLPFLVIGSYFSYVIKSSVLQFLFGLSIIVLAGLMVYSFKTHRSEWDSIATKDFRGLSLVIAAVAGLVTGIFSIGAGTLNLMLLEMHHKLKIINSAATVVAVMAITALVGTLFHASQGIRLDIAMFTIPGVLIGAWVGSWFACSLKDKGWIKVLFIALTMVVGITMVLTSGLF